MVYFSQSIQKVKICFFNVENFIQNENARLLEGRIFLVNAKFGNICEVPLTSGLSIFLVDVD